MKATSNITAATTTTAASLSSSLAGIKPTTGTTSSSSGCAPAPAAVITSSSSSTRRERRIVGGGQQHPPVGAGVHSRSHSSAYKQYYISNSTNKSNIISSSRQRTHGNTTYAWLRNPVVVFFMSFFALGSLRFRVRHHQQHSLTANKPNTSNGDFSSARTTVSQKLRNIPHAVGERLNKQGTSTTDSINNINQAITRTVVATALEANIEEIHQRFNNKPIQKIYPIAAMSAAALPTAKTPPSSADDEFEYVLVEEGKLHKEQPQGPSFQRFAVQEKSTNRKISVQEWAALMLLHNNGINTIMIDFIRTLKNAPYTAYFCETKGVDTTTAAKKAFEFVLVEAPELHRFATQTARRAASKAVTTTQTAPTSTSILSSLAAQVPFSEQFSSKTCEASTSSSSSSLSGDDMMMGCIFDNLSGDATLIAPKPMFSNFAPALVGTTTEQQTNNPDGEKAPIEISAKQQSDYEGQFATYSHLAAFCRGASQAQVEAVLRLAIGAYAQRLQNLENNNSAAAIINYSSSPVWFSTSGMGVAWLHFRLDSRPKYYTYSPFTSEQ